MPSWPTCLANTPAPRVLLDTLDDMESARALYVDLGFTSIAPYYHNPIAGAHYLKTDI